MPHVDQDTRRKYMREYWRKRKADPENGEEVKTRLRETSRRFRKKNRERLRPIWAKWARDKRANETQEEREQRLEISRGRWMRASGLTLDQHHALLEKQDFCCAICGDCTSDLHIDHSHQTGRIRGLLCHGCNVAIGHFREDISRMTNAIEYLRKFNGELCST
jgi:hypothetical protein